MLRAGATVKASALRVDREARVGDLDDDRGLRPTCGSTISNGSTRPFFYPIHAGRETFEGPSPPRPPPLAAGRPGYPRARGPPRLGRRLPRSPPRRARPRAEERGGLRPRSRQALRPRRGAGRDRSRRASTARSSPPTWSRWAGRASAPARPRGTSRRCAGFAASSCASAPSPTDPCALVERPRVGRQPPQGARRSTRSAASSTRPTRPGSAACATGRCST